MKKYGGPGRLKQTCENRRCLNLEKENANEDSTDEQVKKPDERRSSVRRKVLPEKSASDQIENGKSNASLTDIQPKITKFRKHQRSNAFSSDSQSENSNRNRKRSNSDLRLEQTEINESCKSPKLDGPYTQKIKQKSNSSQNILD